MDETPFVETGSLLAIEMGDEDRARVLLNDLGPGGLAELARNARKLAALCDDVREMKRASKT